MHSYPSPAGRLARAQTRGVAARERQAAASTPAYWIRYSRNWADEALVRLSTRLTGPVVAIQLRIGPVLYWQRHTRTDSANL